MPESPKLDLAGLRAECDTLFPTPGPIERAWLYRSLAQVASNVRWLLPFLGDSALVEKLQSLESEALATTPPAQRGARVKRLVGDFGLAGAMVGTGDKEQPQVSAPIQN